MMDRDEIINILQGCETFSALSRGELLQLYNACALKTVHASEALWRAGEPADSAYILLKGRVERSATAHPDGRRTMQFATPGSLLTLASLVQPVEHTSAGTVLEPATVLELPQSVFERLFESEHPAAYSILDALAKELVAEMRDANRRLHEVFGHPAETLRTLRRRLRDEGVASSDELPIIEPDD